MNIHAAIHIENDDISNEYLFIIQDPQVKWNIQIRGNNSFSIVGIAPLNWVSEIVAIAIVPVGKDNNGYTLYKPVALCLGSSGVTTCKLKAPLDSNMDQMKLDRYLNDDGHITYNGSIYSWIR